MKVLAAILPTDLSRAGLNPADVRLDGLRRRHVPLAAGPAAARQARDHVRDTLGSWRVPVDEEVVTLLTSELVTNAIRHTSGRGITLDISWWPDLLRVGVHDSSTAQPVRRDVPPDAETGRGLMLLTALAAEWGVIPDPAGKSVYFTLALAPGVPRPREEQAWGL